MKKILCLLLLVLSFLGPQQRALAQSSTAEPNLDTREALSTILVSGLVGGVLGLSTLSFYSKPERHIKNITWGAAGGMIVAALYLTFDAAATPPGKKSASYEFYPEYTEQGAYALNFKKEF